MKKQTRKDKMDESLGMRRGKESSKKQPYKSRRKESTGMKKAMRKNLLLEIYSPYVESVKK